MGGSTIVRSAPLAWALHSGLPSYKRGGVNQVRVLLRNMRFKANCSTYPIFHIRVLAKPNLLHQRIPICISH